MTPQTQKLLLLGAVGVGVFLLARAAAASQIVQSVTQAVTPQAPKEPGVVLQGKNYGAFIPFPDIGSLLSSLAGTLKSTEDAGDVSVQPGQRMQLLEG